VAAAVAVLAALTAVVALVLARPWPEQPGRVVPPAASPEPEPVAVLSAGTGDAPAPTPAGVRAAIDALVDEVARAGRVSAAVVDVTTGERLYRRDAGTPAVPASTVKLVTAATVLATLGPAHQLATVAVAGAEPGEVVLVGGGDPTLAIDEAGFYPDAARLDQLAAQVRAALGPTPVTRVTVDSTLFTGPVHGRWDADIPGGGYVGPITALMTDGGRADPDPAQGMRAARRWEEPDLAAGRAFARLLGLDPGAVRRGEAPPEPADPGGAPGPSTDPTPAGPTPGGSTPGGSTPGGSAATSPPGPGAGVPSPPAPGTELGRVTSPPVQRLVDIMLTTSDNVVAEALARQVALARGEPASFRGAATAMRATLVEELGLGDAVGDSVLADGSGLSRANRLTATLLTDLLVAAAAPAPRAAGPDDPGAGSATDPAGGPTGSPPGGPSGDPGGSPGGSPVDGRVGADAAPPLAGLAAGLPVAGWSGTLADRYDDPPERPGTGVVRAKTGTLAGVSTLAGLVVTADGRLLAFALLANEVTSDVRDGLDRIAATLATCGCS
jgi:D-alanyl-D-alanine carboxypeptidase/D-alanyl-D-alanine-endopeptidase (penicillin-binding protein 4)